MVRLREAYEADLHKKDTQLEQQMMTNQQLNVRLRQNAERLRRREEEFQEQLQQKETQLQLKDMELQRKTADVSRLQSQLQVCGYYVLISKYMCTSDIKLHTTRAYKTVFTLLRKFFVVYTIFCYDC